MTLSNRFRETCLFSITFPMHSWTGNGAEVELWISVWILRQQHFTQLLKNACLLVADGLGSDAPVQRDLGRGLAHQGLIDQAGLAGAQRVIDGLSQGIAPGFRL